MKVKPTVALPALAGLLAIASLFASCVSLQEAPYAIHNPALTSDCEWEECLIFEFQNRTDKDVSTIGFSWFLYDELEEASGETYEILLEEPVSARESHIFTVPIDSTGTFTGDRAESTRLVDSLTAWLIRYADGTFWTDPWGTYFVSTR